MRDFLDEYGIWLILIGAGVIITVAGIVSETILGLSGCG